MGSMSVVRCPDCGYESGELFGMGGNYETGMDRLIITVACPSDHDLHDTVAQMGTRIQRG